MSARSRLFNATTDALFRGWTSWDECPGAVAGPSLQADTAETAETATALRVMIRFFMDSPRDRSGLEITFFLSCGKFLRTGQPGCGIAFANPARLFPNARRVP